MARLSFDRNSDRRLGLLRFCAALVALSAFPILPALADYRPDLEIRLGGKFSNILATDNIEAMAKLGWMAHYFAEPAGTNDSSGIQVIVFGPPYTGFKSAEELFNAHLGHEQANARLSETTIGGARCQRGPSAVNKFYISTLCLFDKYFVRATKYDPKNRINDTQILTTILARLGSGPAPEGGRPPSQSPDPKGAQALILVTPDGKTVTINLSEWNGGKLSVQQMALVKQFQLAPPAGSDAAKAGTAGYTLNVYNYATTGPNVPVYVAPSLDQGAQAAASAAVEGAQAAASWVKANPGKASLAALGLAVSIAMPYTVAFQASAAGMTFFESAGIGFMTAAAPSAVSSLVTSAIAGEGFWNTTGKAVKSGVISGAESLVSTTVGAGVTGMVTGGAALTQKLVGTELSEAAVTGFGAAASGVAGTATDLGVGILHDQVAEQIANSAAAASIADLVTPPGSAPTGGLVMPLLSRR